MLGLRANLAAMWVPIAVLILWGLFANRKFKNAGANILSGMLGLILGFSPMLLYGAYTHSLKDMFQQSILLIWHMPIVENSGFFHYLHL